jgi:predicted XRE-type DNA-binding protein
MTLAFLYRSFALVNVHNFVYFLIASRLTAKLVPLRQLTRLYSFIPNLTSNSTYSQIYYIYLTNIYNGNKLHIGCKISRILELRGMKQEALVQVLGVSQQAVSNASSVNFNCSFNPLDKVVELYERLVQAERQNFLFGEVT